MSGDDGVLADHRHKAAALPPRWASLSILAGLFGISAVVDITSLIADIVARTKDIHRMLQPIIVASPSSGGTSNAESMRPMGFQYWLDHLLQNMHYPLQVLLYILAACWLYQGIENLNARYASSIGKPARAAIWCLIPAVNLISSIFFLDRLWRASIDIHDWKQRSTPLLLPIWWMVWLASVLSIKLSIFLGNSIEYHIRFEKRLIEHDLISLLALVLSVIVVLRVTQAQRRQFGA